MPLDARLEAARLRELYQNDPRQSAFSALVIGTKGSGKTSLLRTARKPVHIDSWDTGGTMVLRSEILRGDIIADTRYESDDPMNPTMWAEWKRVFQTRYEGGYFHDIATYALDSSTQWGQSCMYHMLKLVKKGTEPMAPYPTWTHYKLQRKEMEDWITKILNLPCDIIFTGHITPLYEEKVIGSGENQEVVREIKSYGFMATGQGTVLIPLKFAELWIVEVTPSATGGKRTILTGREGLYSASSRLNKDGKLSLHEEPNIKKILAKAGWPTTDKPSLFGGEASPPNRKSTQPKA